MRFREPLRNSVAQWLIEDYGFRQARVIALANILIGDGAPGYWQKILDVICEAEKSH